MLLSSRSNPLLLHQTQPKPLFSEIDWLFVCSRFLVLTTLAFIALIPVWQYINSRSTFLLSVVAGLALLTRLVMSVRVIVRAVNTVTKATSGHQWDLLILTGIPARKIVWANWLRVFKQSWAEYTLFLIPMLGLTLALTQVLWSTNWLPDWPIFLQHYIYGSSYFEAGLNPFLVPSIIGILVVVASSLFECALLAAIGIMAGFVWNNKPFMSIFTAILCRVFLLVMMMMSVTSLYEFKIFWRSTCTHFGQNLCEPSNPYPYFQNASITQGFRAIDTVQIALVNTGDQGILTAANIMRPFDNRWIEMRYGSPYRPIKYHYSSAYDNRPYVLRNIVAALLSMSITTLLIYAFLRRATRFAITKHGASGYLEL